MASAIVLILVGCSDDDKNPVDPSNHAPVVDSVRILPDTVSQGEVFTVRSFATDPDGDGLDYDWEYRTSKLEVVPGVSGSTIQLKTCCDISEILEETVHSVVTDGHGGSGRDSARIVILPPGVAF